MEESVFKTLDDKFEYVGKKYKANKPKRVKAHYIKSISIYLVLFVICLLMFYFFDLYISILSGIALIIFIVTDIKSFKKRCAEEDNTPLLDLGKIVFLDDEEVVGHSAYLFKKYLKILLIIGSLLLIISVMFFVTKIKKLDYETLEQREGSVEEIIIGNEVVMIVDGEKYIIEREMITKDNRYMLHSIEKGDMIIFEYSDKNISGSLINSSSKYIYSLSHNLDIILTEDNYLAVYNKRALVQTALAIISASASGLSYLSILGLYLYCEKIKKKEHL